MPIVDGYEATKTILEMTSQQRQKPVIIAVTGHTQNSYIQKAYEAGVRGVLMKPVNAQAISQLLYEMGFIDLMSLQQANLNQRK